MERDSEYYKSGEDTGQYKNIVLYRRGLAKMEGFGGKWRGSTKVDEWTERKNPQIWLRCGQKGRVRRYGLAVDRKEESADMG